MLYSGSMIRLIPRLLSMTLASATVSLSTSHLSTLLKMPMLASLAHSSKTFRPLTTSCPSMQSRKPSRHILVSNHSHTTCVPTRAPRLQVHSLPSMNVQCVASLGGRRRVSRVQMAGSRSLHNNSQLFRLALSSRLVFATQRVLKTCVISGNVPRQF